MKTQPLTADDLFAVLGIVRALARVRQGATEMLLARKVGRRPGLRAFLTLEDHRQLRALDAGTEGAARDLGARLRPYVTVYPIAEIEQRFAAWAERIWGSVA